PDREHVLRRPDVATRKLIPASAHVVAKLGIVSVHNLSRVKHFDEVSQVPNNASSWLIASHISARESDSLCRGPVLRAERNIQDRIHLPARVSRDGLYDFWHPESWSDAAGSAQRLGDVRRKQPLVRVGVDAPAVENERWPRDARAADE